jgi:hypothetical protein
VALALNFMAFFTYVFLGLFIVLIIEFNKELKKNRKNKGKTGLYTFLFVIGNIILGGVLSILFGLWLNNPSPEKAAENTYMFAYLSAIIVKSLFSKEKTSVKSVALWTIWILFVIIVTSIVYPMFSNNQLSDDVSLSDNDFERACDNILQYTFSCDLTSSGEDCEARLLEETGIDEKILNEIVEDCTPYWESKIDADEQIIIDYVDKSTELAAKGAEITMRTVELLVALIEENDYVEGTESPLCPEIKSNSEEYKALYYESIKLDVPDGWEKFADYFVPSMEHAYKYIDENYKSCISTDPHKALEHINSAIEHNVKEGSYNTLVMQEMERMVPSILAMYTN